MIEFIDNYVTCFNLNFLHLACLMIYSKMILETQIKMFELAYETPFVLGYYLLTR